MGFELFISQLMAMCDSIYGSGSIREIPAFMALVNLYETASCSRKVARALSQQPISGSITYVFNLSFQGEFRRFFTMTSTPGHLRENLVSKDIAVPNARNKSDRGISLMSEAFLTYVAARLVQ